MPPIIPVARSVGEYLGSDGEGAAWSVAKRWGVPFISTWTTTTSDQVVTLPLISGGTYSFGVDWGDGNQDVITAWDQAEKAHTYSGVAATYTITITGICKGFQFNNAGDKTVITTISQWGDLDITTNGAFYGCTNLNVTATDAPLLTSTSLRYMFRDCTSLTTPNLNSWDTSGVTDMLGMFQGATSFNGTVAGWDTGSVATTQNMFLGATSFNQAIGVWDMSSNAHVGGMFYRLGVMAFDQNVGGWNIGQVANGTNFMGTNSMSTANYDALLIGWQGQTHQPTVTFKGGGSKYSAGAAATARAALVTDGWTITDGGAA
jgi:surface protein